MVRNLAVVAEALFDSASFSTHFMTSSLEHFGFLFASQQAASQAAQYDALLSLSQEALDNSAQSDAWLSRFDVEYVRFHLLHTAYVPP
jgi:hypothetical protein